MLLLGEQEGDSRRRQGRTLGANQKDVYSMGQK